MPNEGMPAATSIMLKMSSSSAESRGRRRRRRSNPLPAVASSAKMKKLLMGKAVRPTQVPRMTRSLKGIPMPNSNAHRAPAISARMVMGM